MIVAFDLDGTVADSSHRSKYAIAKDWAAFNALAYKDKEIKPTAAILRAMHQAGHRVEIWTARSDDNRAMTADWLAAHFLPYDLLRMRKEGDWRRAYIVKLEWYLQRSPADRPQLVFEDHPETTRLLRAAGAIVHQVAEGHQSP